MYRMMADIEHSGYQPHPPRQQLSPCIPSAVIDNSEMSTTPFRMQIPREHGCATGRKNNPPRSSSRRRKRRLHPTLELSVRAILVVLFLTLQEYTNDNTCGNSARSSNNISFPRQLQVDAFVIINPTIRREMPTTSIALSDISSSSCRRRPPFHASSQRQFFWIQSTTRLWNAIDQESGSTATMVPATLTLENGLEQPFTMNGNSVNGFNNHQGSATSLSTSSSASIPNALTLPDDDDVPHPTANGGYSHTKASRAKISAANKGKTPWNKGKARSEEVRARIAAGVRKRNRERLLKKLEEMGLTEEEYEEQKKAARRKKDAERRARRTPKGGFTPTPETRAKISKALKEKHATGQIKKRILDPSKVRRGFKHTEETRRKISESLKKKWRDDGDYRDNMISSYAKANSREETRKKISDSLKKRWQDPDFRKNMAQVTGNRKSPNVVYDETYRQKISDAMKRKWQDPEYRSKTVNSIQMAAQNRAATNPPKRRVKKSSSARRKKKEAPELQLVATLTAEDIAKRQKKRAEGKKKSTKATTTSAKDTLVPVEPRKPATKPTQRVKGATAPTSIPNEQYTEEEEKPKQKKKKAKKKKEKDGSVSRLREERRDLFDLLYGDEDGLLEDAGETAPDGGEPSAVSKMGTVFGDDDLDSFDPYGLDDY